ncbi:MAG: Rpn family recombination-promoting nuclease/putative transposase [Lachnospiraceae bacterium]|nr:Rpn family recombination-promoting nuclease/putative transposase [Lachnospiraceae bacterium]
MKENNRIPKQAPDTMRDISSKRIFQDPVLCSQFLRDNMDIPEFKNVQPEDIEDVSERYYPFIGSEFQSDTVKRIHIRNADGSDKEESVYLISLIEHKSGVDYNVSMQILKYMVCIWDDYGKEQERIKEGVTKRKYFKYPAILPIVYYEGAAKWTADMHLRDRIQKGNAFGCYIPDFIYRVVRNHDYTNEELLARGDAISLLMMINKVQTAEDFREFCQSPPEEMDQILKNTSKSIRGTIRDTMYGLLMKMNVPVDEANQYVESVEGCRMGYLFENMEKIDIQEERRKTAEEREKREKIQKESEELKQEVEGLKQEAKDAKREVEGLKQEAEDAKQEAEDAKQEAEDAKQEAEDAKQEIERLKKLLVLHGVPEE